MGSALDTGQDELEMGYVKALKRIFFPRAGSKLMGRTEIFSSRGYSCCPGLRTQRWSKLYKDNRDV